MGSKPKPKASKANFWHTEMSKNDEIGDAYWSLVEGFVHSMVSP
jgi:hypothetical protein